MHVESCVMNLYTVHGGCRQRAELSTECAGEGNPTGRYLCNQGLIELRKRREGM